MNRTDELARFGKPKSTSFFSYVEYRSNTSNKQYYERQITIREVTNRRGSVKEGSKEEGSLIFLYKNEYRIFKPVEITIRRRLR
jgi:hypothetical protein